MNLSFSIKYKISERPFKSFPYL